MDYVTIDLNLKKVRLVVVVDDDDDDHDDDDDDDIPHRNLVVSGGLTHHPYLFYLFYFVLI